MDPQFLKAKFDSALTYARYVVTGTEEQQRRWQQAYELAATAVTAKQRSTIGGFARVMNVLVVSGIWCGDFVQQCALIERLAEANPAKVRVRYLDRDEHKDLSSRLRVNAGDRVPVVVFAAEDFEFCAAYGDRTLNRYRALAVRQLGASCPTGLVAPDQNELADTVQDWADEIERVQLMLRLSPRLRAKHGD